jgi:hypothetical protein
LISELRKITQINKLLKTVKMDIKNESKEWKEILTDCSINSAKLILILQCLLYAVSSKLFFFLFLLLISMGTATFFYVYKGAPFCVFISSIIIQFSIYLLFDKVLDKNWDYEQIKMKYGIHEIKSYIKNYIIKR